MAAFSLSSTLTQDRFAPTTAMARRAVLGLEPFQKFLSGQGCERQPEPVVLLSDLHQGSFGMFTETWSPSRQHT
jgi:hypothetical protein